MSQLRTLTRCLLAAGGATLPEQEGMFLLYVDDDSTLISKRWTGCSFKEEELIATSIRPNSTAVYLATPSDKLTICISSSSTLRALTYDDDAEEWVDEESIGRHKVHSKGKVAGSMFEGGRRDVFFQGASRQLVHLDKSWKATVLPVNAIEGSPLVTSGDDVTLYLFYVSADDNCVHYATHREGGKWSDSVFSPTALGGKKRPERFLVSQGEDGAFEVFVLTKGRALLQLLEDGGETSLGKVNAAGEWVPGTTEEATVRVLPGLGRRGVSSRKEDTEPVRKEDARVKKPKRRITFRIFFSW